MRANMPLIRKIEREDSVVGIWHITETFEELCRMLPNGECVRTECGAFSSEKRKREYAAVRALLFVLAGRQLTVDYFPSGRPFLRDERMNISISHTAGYAAVILSETHDVGLDIEAVNNRILKLKNHIVSEEEQADGLYELLLHWCGKEVAFKLLDREGIDFRKDMIVKDLLCSTSEASPVSCGSFLLCFHLKTDKRGCFRMTYETTPHFVLVYAVAARGKRK